MKAIATFERFDPKGRAGWIGRVVEALRSARTAHQKALAARDLARLSDRQLEDVGVSRADLEDAGFSAETASAQSAQDALNRLTTRHLLGR